MSGERTHFDPVDPPKEVTLYFCPACGQKITRNYNLDAARKRCSKTWHLAMAKPQRYQAALPAPTEGVGDE